MNTFATWYLVILLTNGNVVLPMASEKACMEAIKPHGNYCYNTQTGEEEDRYDH